MIDWLCTIPENILWMINGALALGCVLTLKELGVVLVDFWKNWHDDAEEYEE
jgi:hypothetical protein